MFDPIQSPAEMFRQAELFEKDAREYEMKALELRRLAATFRHFAQPIHHAPKDIIDGLRP